MAYEQYKTYLMPTRDAETPLRRLAAGSLAGVTSVFITYPLDVLRVRIAYEVELKSTMREAVRELWKEDAIHKFKTLGSYGTTLGGLSNFYRGFLPTIYGMIPYAGVSFLTYETLTNWLQEQPVACVPDQDKVQLRIWASLFAGGLAGVIAQSVSYPFEIVRRHMQVAGTLTHFKTTQTGGRLSLSIPQGTSHHEDKTQLYRNTWSTAKTIYTQRGIRGFFVGLSIGYLKVTPMVATSFAVYDWCKRHLEIE